MAKIKEYDRNIKISGISTPNVTSEATANIQKIKSQAFLGNTITELGTQFANFIETRETAKLAGTINENVAWLPDDKQEELAAIIQDLDSSIISDTNKYDVRLKDFADLTGTNYDSLLNIQRTNSLNSITTGYKKGLANKQLIHADFGSYIRTKDHIQEAFKISETDGLDAVHNYNLSKGIGPTDPRYRLFTNTQLLLDKNKIETDTSGMVYPNLRDQKISELGEERAQMYFHEMAKYAGLSPIHQIIHNIFDIEEDTGSYSYFTTVNANKYISQDAATVYSRVANSSDFAKIGVTEQGKFELGSAQKHVISQLIQNPLVEEIGLKLHGNIPDRMAVMDDLMPMLAKVWVGLEADKTGQGGRFLQAIVDSFHVAHTSSWIGSDIPGTSSTLFDNMNQFSISLPRAYKINGTDDVNMDIIESNFERFTDPGLLTEGSIEYNSYNQANAFNYFIWRNVKDDIYMTNDMMSAMYGTLTEFSDDELKTRMFYSLMDNSYFTQADDISQGVQMYVFNQIAGTMEPVLDKNMQPITLPLHLFNSEVSTQTIDNWAKEKENKVPEL